MPATTLACARPQVYKPINPKAVTRNELYGYLHPASREWKEGLVSVIFTSEELEEILAKQKDRLVVMFCGLSWCRWLWGVFCE